MELSSVEHTPKKKFRKHKNNSKYNDNLVDRISELPLELLARILSSLSFEEVVRTSVLSRAWRDLWKSFTRSLNFDASKKFTLSSRKLQKRSERYAEWITRVLNSHKAPTIDELRVRCDLTIEYTSNINRWIEIALLKKVRRLELDFKPCRSLLHRTASYEFGREFCGSSEIKFLTSLCFKHVKLSSQVLESLLSNCPLLETLHVSHSPSEQLTKLNVCGSSLRLKRLHISFCNINRIEIYAPNLVSFEYNGGRLWHLVLNYVPQLHDVSYGVPWDNIGYDVLQTFPGYLSTCGSQLVNLSVKFMFEIEILSCPKLSNLRYLTCDVGYFTNANERKGLLPLLHLLDSSPLLNKFKVKLEMKDACRLMKGSGEIKKVVEGVETMIENGTRCEMKSLREVEIVGFKGAVADTALLIYLAKTALDLDYIIINTRLDALDWNDKQGTKKQEEARRIAYDLLLEHRPEGANIHVL